MPTIEKKKNIFISFKNWLASLSFRTGIIVLGLCALCYVISFAQFLLPTDAGTKGILFATFFGLAKATQYIGLIIIGKAGLERIKRWKEKRQKNG